MKGFRIMVGRYANWPERLADAVMAVQSRPFQWGRHDCALFAADVIQAMTGVDVAVDFRGRYRTALGAARKIKQYAGGGLEELAVKMAAEHGLERVAVPFARRGDVALIDTEIGPALGVVLGRGVVFAGRNGGLERRRVAECRRVWRI